MRKLSKRTIASRANGKLSHGPVTPAGLLRASANSTRHGILSKSVLVGGEDAEIFALLHQQYIDRINPTDGIEISLVEELTATVWRQRRLMAIETDLLNDAAKKHTGPGCRIAAAFAELSRGPELHLIDRYESRLHRMFQRTLKNIQLIREIEHTHPSAGELTQLPHLETKVPTPESIELPNEPKCEQLPVESEAYPATLNPQSEPAAESAPGEEARPQPSLQLLQRPSTSTVHELLSEPKSEESSLESATGEMHELPNEPRSEQPGSESANYPPTSNPKFEPASNPVFVVDPRTGQLRRVA
jgi:hypothetical protein